MNIYIYVYLNVTRVPLFSMRTRSRSNSYPAWYRGEPFDFVFCSVWLCVRTSRVNNTPEWATRASVWPTVRIQTCFAYGLGYIFILIKYEFVSFRMTYTYSDDRKLRRRIRWISASRSPTTISFLLRWFFLFLYIVSVDCFLFVFPVGVVLRGGKCVLCSVPAYSLSLVPLTVWNKTPPPPVHRRLLRMSHERGMCGGDGASSNCYSAQMIFKQTLRDDDDEVLVCCNRQLCTSLGTKHFTRSIRIVYGFPVCVHKTSPGTFLSTPQRIAFRFDTFLGLMLNSAAAAADRITLNTIAMPAQGFRRVVGGYVIFFFVSGRKAIFLMEVSTRQNFRDLSQFRPKPFRCNTRVLRASV